MSATRKVVEMTVKVVFEGDYYDKYEVVRTVRAWIGAALEDRDDLRTVAFGAATVVETELDDE